MRFVPPEKLYPCTNCGMVPLAREVALGKLKALASGAALMRREIRGERPSGDSSI
jgi:5-methyltetrahydropteroyltriglutamate--homocysteine methyltransferase